MLKLKQQYILGSMRNIYKVSLMRPTWQQAISEKHLNLSLDYLEKMAILPKILLMEQCVYSRGLLNAQIELIIHSRPEITLTDQQYSMLQRRVVEFNNANAAARS